MSSTYSKFMKKEEKIYQFGERLFLICRTLQGVLKLFLYWKYDQPISLLFFVTQVEFPKKILLHVVLCRLRFLHVLYLEYHQINSIGIME